MSASDTLPNLLAWVRHNAPGASVVRVTKLHDVPGFSQVWFDVGSHEMALAMAEALEAQGLEASAGGGGRPDGPQPHHLLVLPIAGPYEHARPRENPRRISRRKNPGSLGACWSCDRDLREGDRGALPYVEGLGYEPVCEACARKHGLQGRGFPTGRIAVAKSNPVGLALVEGLAAGVGVGVSAAAIHAWRDRKGNPRKPVVTVVSKGGYLHHPKFQVMRDGQSNREDIVRFHAQVGEAVKFVEEKAKKNPSDHERCKKCGCKFQDHKSGTDSNGPAGKCPPALGWGRPKDFPRFSRHTTDAKFDADLARYWSGTEAFRNPRGRSAAQKHPGRWAIHCENPRRPNGKCPGCGYSTPFIGKGQPCFLCQPKLSEQTTRKANRRSQAPIPALAPEAMADLMLEKLGIGRALDRAQAIQSKAYWDGDGRAYAYWTEVEREVYAPVAREHDLIEQGVRIPARDSAARSLGYRNPLPLLAAALPAVKAGLIGGAAWEGAKYGVRHVRGNPGLADAAESWAASRGFKIPARGTAAWQGMFAAWQRGGMRENPGSRWTVGEVGVVARAVQHPSSPQLQIGSRVRVEQVKHWGKSGREVKGPVAGGESRFLVRGVEEGWPSFGHEYWVYESALAKANPGMASLLLVGNKPRRRNSPMASLLLVGNGRDAGRVLGRRAAPPRLPNRGGFKVDLPRDRVKGTITLAEARRRWPERVEFGEAAFKDFHRGSAQVSNDVILYDDGKKEVTVGWTAGTSPEVTYGGATTDTPDGSTKNEALWVHKTGEESGRPTYLVGLVPPKDRRNPRNPVTTDFQLIGNMTAKKGWLTD
jgi:hypothetical protein